jgi:hypothetical protein
MTALVCECLCVSLARSLYQFVDFSIYHFLPCPVAVLQCCSVDEFPGFSLYKSFIRHNEIIHDFAL